MLALQSAKYLEQTCDPDPCPPGTPGRFLARYNAKNAGKTTFKLAYVAPDGKTVGRRFRLTARVK